MKNVQITEDQAKQMFESGIESLKSIAETTYPELFKKEIQWSDFGEVKGCYIGSQSKLYDYESPSSNSANRNIFPTTEEAEACLALSQLCQWRDKYNEGSKPDYTSMYTKYQIYFYRGQISKDNHLSTSFVLTFKTSEIRDKFLEDFSELINQAKSLL